MNKKVLHRCSLIILLVFLIACGKQTIVPPTGTPISTPLLSTETLVPTASVTPAPTSTFMWIAPTPLPAEPIIPLLTPDISQVERWNEYENALSTAFFKSFFRPEDVVCEWVILGRVSQEVYIYALCAAVYSAGPSTASIPAVIHIQMDGSVVSAEIPGNGTAYGTDIRRMFPLNVQEVIFSRTVLFSKDHEDHLRLRRAHPKLPPLIVLPFLPAQPTEPVILWDKPESAQIEKWKEYQTALAVQFDYRPSEEIICEWEELGRVGNEIYVWTVCGAIRDNRVGLEGLAIIYVSDDGSVVQVLSTDDRSRFPSNVQKKYFNGSIHFQELVDHLRWRQSQERWNEPPLIVLKATTS